MENRKIEIRNKVKLCRQSMAPEQEAVWNEAILKKIMALKSVRLASCVYCYVSFQHEVGTKRVIECLLEMGKYVAVPKVNGKKLDFYALQSRRDLEPGVMGIMEPKEDCLRIRDLHAPVIVPGIAFDKEGRRIGYGGGYYDRFFEEEPEHEKIGIAYPFQIFDTVPAESHDKSMDMVITP